MYWNDHDPPHFHAKYGKHEIIIFIADGIIEGKFPKRALKLVLEWLKLHKEELLENWNNARKGKILKNIAPLE